MSAPRTHADRIEKWLSGTPAAELGEDKIRDEFVRLNEAMAMVFVSCQAFGDKLEAAADEILDKSNVADGPTNLGMAWGIAMQMQRTYVWLSQLSNNLIIRARHVK